MFTVPLPPGANPIAVKYIIYIYISKGVICVALQYYTNISWRLGFILKSVENGDVFSIFCSFLERYRMNYSSGYVHDIWGLTLSLLADIATVT
jgi:hypothetical protein